MNEATLRWLCLEGYTNGQIAAYFGTTVKAVEHKKARLGLIRLRGRTPPPCAAPHASYVMPSYLPTVSRSAWERMFEFPPGAPPGYLGTAARTGRWASGTPGAERRVGRGHRRAR